jgi:hypothetical protein
MRWLLLLHQIPPKPGYLRAKILRRLSLVGALAVKNSAYLLPDTEDALEDLEWICREIEENGGSAWMFRAETLAGMSSGQIENAFRQLHTAEYKGLIEQARSLLQPQAQASDETLTVYRRWLRRCQELRRLDFFGNPLREELERVMQEIDRLQKAEKNSKPALPGVGRVWVTRKGVRIDRIASAWLIRRFIDPEARFRFVEPNGYDHQHGEVRFDMFEGEFTHQGECCTFEVLLSAHGLETDTGLAAIAEMVHDIDLKDRRYQRPETAGLARLIDGLCSESQVDELRLQRGSVIFESLHKSFA